jgi:hypothetical protein
MTATLLPPSLIQPAIGDGSFPAGTPIAVPSTDGGPTERPVESLARGDKVLTLAGPVAVRHVATTRHAPGPLPRERLVPVRVAAGAFGEGQPVADLLLAPEQPVYVLDAALPQGALAPVGALVNGASISREPQADAPAWVRLELESPGVVIAAGLLVAARIDPAAPPPAALLPAGPATLALRQRLARPADAAPDLPAPDLPPPETPAPEPAVPQAAEAAAPEAPAAAIAAAAPAGEAPPVLRIVVNGGSLALLDGSTELSWAVELPAGTGLVQLRSPPGLPANIAESERAGSRRYGVAIRAMLLDDRPIPLDGPAIGNGFHAMEAAGPESWRWTDGEAVVHLPQAPEPRRLTVIISDWHRLLQPA